MELPPNYDQSVDVLRFELEAGRADATRLHLHAGTFLFWAVALDGSLRSRNRGEYTRPRDGAIPQQFFDGLNLARNALAHGAVVAAKPGGITIPITVPFSIPPARWRAYDEISSWPERIEPPPHAVAAYRRLLEGEPVRDFMELTLAWFEGLA